MSKHIDIEVYGRVQGVGYRFSCMQEAYKCGVKGFVKNRPDGSVYIEAEGSDEQLQSFVEWCKRGPVWAKVIDLKISEGDMKNFTSFEIERSHY